MVYLDQKIQADLGVPTDKPLNRGYHARLLRQLKEAGARLVLFDFLFLEPSDDPKSDREFAEAITNHGRVVLMGCLDKAIQANGLLWELKQPAEMFRTAAAGWGLAELVDPKQLTLVGDEAIRELYGGSEEAPSAGWAAAAVLSGGAPAGVQVQNSKSKVQGSAPQPGQAVGPSDFERGILNLEKRWLNYYGQPAVFNAVHFNQVLTEDGTNPGFFRDKIVVVGSRPSVWRVAGDSPEEFRTPFSRFGAAYASGAQIHALSLLNLLHGDWLERLSPNKELALVILCGLILGAGLALVRPWPAVGLAFAGAALMGSVATYIQLHHHLWWSWMTPVAVQTPLALVWSVGYQYAVESGRRKMLRQAFAAYLSPHLADRIADEEFDLSLGGKVVEATVMFTDLEGFTALSETLKPQEVSALLIAYFTQTTSAILEREGTIIKYVGDSVMAVWNAPLTDPKHAEHAVKAAWELAQKGEQQIVGRRLRTRIGINSGPGLAGNLGSKFRFDYSVIGDTTNVASRLESLNKQLGTRILISEATLGLLSDPVQTRALGRFRVAGKTQPVAIHELLGVGPAGATQPGWRAAFDEALRDFGEGRFDSAAKLFSQVIELRGGDGPSEFYVHQIAAARQNARPGDTWSGVVQLGSK